MALFRDWPRTLKAASYRGAPFFVAADEIETGRRLVVHEFPHKDEPYVEDLGREANKVTVTAYVLGDDADQAERRLRRACEQGGAASLVLPIDRLQAHCESCSRDFSKDKQGYIAFKLKFVREGTGAGPFPAGFLSALVGQVASGLTAPLGAYADRSIATVGVNGGAAEAAAGAVREAAIAITATASAMPLAPAAAPAILRAAADLWSDAETLAALGGVGNAWAGRSFRATEQSAPVAAADPAGLVGRVTAVVDMMAEAATPAAVAEHLDGLKSFAAPLPVPAGTTAGWFREAANIAAVSAVLRVAALRRWVEAKTAITYTDRRRAIQSRADVAEAIDAELSTIDGPAAHDLAVGLADLRGRAVELLTRRVTDLAPIVELSAGREMPSLWWANWLYGDASRAEALARQNRARHPSFMGVTIEASV